MQPHPRIRFPEFAEEWEEKILGEQTVTITKGTTPKNFISGNVTYVKIESLEGIHINTEKCSRICHDVHLGELKRSILQEKDILFAIAGATVGKVGVVTHNILPANTNQALAIIRLKNKKFIPFLLHILQSRQMAKYIYESLSVGAQPNLTLKQIEQFTFYSPSLTEQKKIANFLSYVDAKINNLMQQKAYMQQYKKGCMQKLFSQEIRFKDDDGNAFPDWEDKTIGDVLTESRIKGSTGDNARKLTVKLWRKGVYAKEEVRAGSENTQYYIRKKNQFIYSKLDFLNCAFGVIPEELDGFESTVDLPCFDIAPSVSPKFLLERISQKNFYKKYGDKADGSRKAKRIHAITFLEMPIQLPSLPEQKKITNFLSTIDDRIEALDEQLEAMKEFKKGLLQRMFV